MEGKKLYFRLTATAALTAALALVMVVRLYDMQIVHGLSYSEESEKRITRTVEVKAARGEMVDRYGRKLVTNRIAYNVGFDMTLLPDGRENEIIARLLETADEFSVSHDTFFPLERTSAGRWRYTSSTTGKNRMARFLAAMGWTDGDEPDAEWQSVFSADELAGKLCEEYGVEPESERAREVLALRWELDLRTPRIGLNIAPYVFANDVPGEFIASVAERDLPGVEILTDTVRQYETEYAANLLGRVTPIYDTDDYDALKEKGYALDDMIGRDGAEAAFEDILRGVDGVRVEERSESGSVTNVMYSREPKPGDNVMLTIDIRLQEAAEKALASRIQSLKETGEAGGYYGSKDVGGGAVVVVDVKNFDILAAANYPTFSLSTYYEDQEKLISDPLTPMVNRAFVGHYAPGSTFKMSTAVAALETGAIEPSTRIYDKGIYTYYAPSYTPVCEVYPGSHGNVDVIGALRVSCNYFFYEAGRLTGIENMNRFGRALGLGQPTGVELPEYTGVLAGPEEREAAGGTWYGGDTIQAAIGQSDNNFSPLQLAVYIASLANPDGVRLDAHLLKSVRSYDYQGTVSEHRSTVLARVDISEETRATVLAGMRAVTQFGGSANGTFGNYPIAVGAKTGSAQTGQGSATGIFVAFAPYEDPQIAVAVVVEHANKGSWLAVVARDVMDAYFRTDSAFHTAEAEGGLLN